MKEFALNTGLRMDEKEFKKHAEDALEDLQRVLAAASDDYGFNTDLEDGVLTIEFERRRARFVINPNAQSRQIWVSAQSKSYKLDWDYVENTFIYRGQTLREVLEEAMGKQLGEEVNL